MGVPARSNGIAKNTNPGALPLTLSLIRHYRQPILTLTLTGNPDLSLTLHTTRTPLPASTWHTHPRQAHTQIQQDMALPDHLLTLATLRLLTLTPLSSSSSPSSNQASGGGGVSSSSISTSNNRFHSVRSHPLRILTELTAAYLQLLGNAAREHAEQAGRTAVNALDARQAIQDYGGSIEEIDDWARECQLDRGILSSNDALMHGDEAGRADADDLGAMLKGALPPLRCYSCLIHMLTYGHYTDTAYNQAYRAPTQVLEYAPLTDREAAVVSAVQRNDTLLPFLRYDIQQAVQKAIDRDGDGYVSSSSSTSDEDAPSTSSSRGRSPPPPSYQEATATATGTLSSRQREKLPARETYDEDDKENDPLSFLPPFPDLDATQASLQTIIEDESGRIVKRARRALDATLNMNMTGGANARKNASIAWLRAVPYEASSLAEYEGGKFSVPSIQKEKDDGARIMSVDGKPIEEVDLEEEDAFAASSLPYFLETFDWVALEYEQQGDQALLPLPHNSKRKRAATAIHSNILNPSDDSLSGSIPALPPRHAKKQAGWIPYPPINPDIADPSEPGGKAIRPFPIQLHPFTTQLPPSITEPVPQLVLPHASKVLAPPMHPRYPTAHTSIRTLLESSSPALFSRTTRMGPPGPLLDNGAAGFYQIEQEKPIIPGWPGDAMPRMMGWNFDWEIGNELEDAIAERKNAGIVNMVDGKGTAESSGRSTNYASASERRGPQTPAAPPLPTPTLAPLPPRPASGSAAPPQPRTAPTPSPAPVQTPAPMAIQLSSTPKPPNQSSSAPTPPSMPNAADTSTSAPVMETSAPTLPLNDSTPALAVEPTSNSRTQSSAPLSDPPYVPTQPPRPAPSVASSAEAVSALDNVPPAQSASTLTPAPGAPAVERLPTPTAAPEHVSTEADRSASTMDADMMQDGVSTIPTADSESETKELLQGAESKEPPPETLSHEFPQETQSTESMLDSQSLEHSQELDIGESIQKVEPPTSTRMSET